MPVGASPVAVDIFRGVVYCPHSMERGRFIEGGATEATLLAAKGATAKAQLDYMKDEIAYRVAHAQLLNAIGQE